MRKVQWNEALVTRDDRKLFFPLNVNMSSFLFPVFFSPLFCLAFDYKIMPILIHSNLFLFTFHPFPYRSFKNMKEPLYSDWVRNTMFESYIPTILKWCFMMKRFMWWQNVMNTILPFSLQDLTTNLWLFLFTGRLVQGGARGPGIFFIIPCIDTYCKVDLRTVSFDVPPQEVSTKTTFLWSKNDFEEGIWAADIDSWNLFLLFNPTPFSFSCLPSLLLAHKGIRSKVISIPSIFHLRSPHFVNECQLLRHCNPSSPASETNSGQIHVLPRTSFCPPLDCSPSVEEIEPVQMIDQFTEIYPCLHYVLPQLKKFSFISGIFLNSHPETKLEFFVILFVFRLILSIKTKS